MRPLAARGIDKLNPKQQAHSETETPCPMFTYPPASLLTVSSGPLPASNESSDSCGGLAHVWDEMFFKIKRTTRELRAGI
jgi:hypothetical protein